MLTRGMYDGTRSKYVLIFRVEREDCCYLPRISYSPRTSRHPSELDASIGSIKRPMLVHSRADMAERTVQLLGPCPVQQASKSRAIS